MRPQAYPIAAAAQMRAMLKSRVAHPICQQLRDRSTARRSGCATKVI
jgi:hypothetical protein